MITEQDRYRRYLEDRPRVLGVCTWCGGPVLRPKRYWCSDDCIHQWNLRRDGTYLRESVEKRDKGICASCGVDCHGLELSIKKLKRAGLACWYRKDYPEAYRLMDLFWKTLEGIGIAPPENRHDFRKFSWFKRSLWEADHIIPVSEGGGCAGLDNLTSLCPRCHKEKTAKDAGSRARARAEEQPVKKPKPCSKKRHRKSSARKK